VEGQATRGVLPRLSPPRKRLGHIHRGRQDLEDAQVDLRLGLPRRSRALTRRSMRAPRRLARGRVLVERRHDGGLVEGREGVGIADQDTP
jgi:hypothetical protein